jgi:hypothetical protein
MRQERKMINLSRETAIKLAQLKLDFSMVIGDDLSYSMLINLLHQNRAAVIGSLKLMNRIKINF